MFEMKLSQVAVQLARQMIIPHNTVYPDAWNERDLALKMKFRMDSDYHANPDIPGDKARSEVVVIHVIVTGRHRVYVAKTDHIAYIPKAEEYVNTSNHDSCWREGVESPFTEEYFKAAKSVLRDHPEIPPKDMATFCTFSGFGDNVFEYVRVKFGDKRKDNDYFDTLTEVTPIKFRVAFDEVPEQIGYVDKKDIPRLSNYKATIWPGVNEIDAVPVFIIGEKTP